jgi:hypothetical protein
LQSKTSTNDYKQLVSVDPAANLWEVLMQHCRCARSEIGLEQTSLSFDARAQSLWKLVELEEESITELKTLILDVSTQGTGLLLRRGRRRRTQLTINQSENESARKRGRNFDG